ncbi:MAG: hypothetical protein LIO96_09445, partial [Lachnospiraceae bacterium]|nr:hypothetical protein [Lachnospiraceae bacterium]
HHLVINKSEQEKLDWLFRIEKVGRDVFGRRIEVEHLLRYFTAIRKSMEDDVYHRKVQPEFAGEGESAPSVRQLCMEVDIIDAIQYMIIRACEAPGEVHIYMDAFEQTIYAMQQMIREGGCSGRKQITCHQFLTVERNPDLHGGVVGNLKTLQYIIPFSFSFRGKYEANYSYVSSNDPGQNFSLWPHYIVTEHHVLLLSDSGKNALLIENDRLAGGYIAELQQMSGRCRLLFPFADDPEASLACYAAAAAESQPVCSYGFTPDAEEALCGETDFGVQLYEPDRVFFFAREAEGVRCICAAEQGMYRVFLDYFESLEV